MAELGPAGNRHDMMKRFKLDPNKVPQMTAAEAPIDYSDIPELDDDFFKNAARMKSPPQPQTPTQKKKTTSSRS
jgi:hypothetical protein